MPRAIWNDTIVAESDDCIVLEGNIYFPPDAVREEYLEPSPKTTVCPWKGEAKYYDLVVGGEVNEGAAWYYPSPKSEASDIEDYVAFWSGVRVEE
jgi:uncharacterized protein (DUF427 family)